MAGGKGGAKGQRKAKGQRAPKEPPIRCIDCPLAVKSEEFPEYLTCPVFTSHLMRPEWYCMAGLTLKGVQCLKSAGLKSKSSKA